MFEITWVVAKVKGGQVRAFSEAQVPEVKPASTLRIRVSGPYALSPPGRTMPLDDLMAWMDDAHRYGFSFEAVT